MRADHRADADPARTLDDDAVIRRVDPHRAREVLAAFPDQCRDAVSLRPVPALDGPRPRCVVVAGMGGSAAGGDLLAACAAGHVPLPILVHRGYGLPKMVGKEDLVIACSYSGDTEESFSAAEAGLARGCRVACLTSGGRLGALASARALPCVRVPGGLMPRMALGYMFLPLLALLLGAGLEAADPGAVEEALALLGALAGQLAPERPAAVNEAKRLALAIGDRVPAVYGGPGTGGVAYRWKTDLEENAKVFALAGALPEMNHNEIEAWRAPAARRLHAILLREPDEAPQISRRFALFRELVADAAGGVSETTARGEGTPARLLGLAYLGAWVSYYLAVRRGVDPWTVPLLDRLKARLRERTAS